MHVKLFTRPGSPWRDIVGRQIVAVSRADGSHIYLGDGGTVVRSATSLDSVLGRSESVEGEDLGDRLVVPAIGLMVAPPPWALEQATTAVVAEAPLPGVQELLAPAIPPGDATALLDLLNNIVSKAAPWWQGSIKLEEAGGAATIPAHLTSHEEGVQDEGSAQPG